jgi:hypothetical protein
VRLGGPTTQQGPTPPSLSAGRCASAKESEHLPRQRPTNFFYPFMLFMVFMVTAFPSPFPFFFPEFRAGRCASVKERERLPRQRAMNLFFFMLFMVNAFFYPFLFLFPQCFLAK